jgi:hypothetical protein
MHKKRCLRNTFCATAMFLFLMHILWRTHPKNWSDMQNNETVIRYEAINPHPSPHIKPP